MKTQAAREKRTKPVTVHFTPTFRQALEQLSSHEQRSLSTLVVRIVERDPVVKIFLQQIGRPVGN